jgi:hypothetical protein
MSVKVVYIYILYIYILYIWFYLRKQPDLDVISMDHSVVQNFKDCLHQLVVVVHAGFLQGKLLETKDTQCFI